MDVTSLDRRLTEAYAVTADSTAKKGYNRFQQKTTQPVTETTQTVETTTTKKAPYDTGPDLPSYVCFSYGGAGYRIRTCTATEA